MNNKVLSIALAFLAVIASGRLRPTLAQTQPAQAPPIQFSEETLDNGLHVIYAPLHQAPVVHVRVLYHVGSRDERPDRQGFAHMFEHMMFRGSAHVAPEEHMKRIGQVGGYSNAYTSFDETVYVNTIPAQYLDMALWLEADRMASFKVSDEIFQTERKVVAEEWRMRHNQPYGDVFERYLAAAFKVHPYRWTPIGDMNDLKAASAEELQKFFNSYYVPNNATLVVSGDFDDAEARQLVHRYYGWIPRAPAPPRDQIKPEPTQEEPRTVTIDEPVPMTMVMIGYRIPGYKSDDHYALSALDTILGSGDSSRLSRLLVNGETPMCVSASSMHWQSQDPSIFAVSGVVMAGKDAEKVKTLLAGAVADVVKDGVSADELDKAKTMLRVGIIRGRETADELASQLAEESVFGGDAERVNTALAKIDALTPKDLQRVAAEYLQPERATTLVVKPSMLAAVEAKAAATQAEALKSAPVQPSTEPVKPRVTEFPADYPTTAPTASPRPAPELAKGTETTVNGIKVIVMPDPRLPLVSWSLTMRRGSQSDPKGKEGLAWLTSEMLKRGVEGLDFEALTRDLDSRAISINVGEGGDYSRLSGSCTTDQLEHGIQRSRQVLLTPTFPQNEFAKLQEQSLNSLKLGQESPTVVAQNELTTALYGDTPLGRYATPESVEGITLDDIKGFYKTFYRPNNAILILSGDVTVERGQALAKQLIDGWEPGPLPPVEIDLPEAPSKRRIILVDRPEGKQATVRMGIPAYTIRSDEKFPGSVATQILTAGIDSRLGKYVRAEKGLAYAVHGVFQANRHSGAFIAGTDTAIESTAQAIEAMFKVFDDMRSQDVKPDELTEAKTRVAGQMVMQVQTIQQQASYRVEGILNDYPIDYYDKYPERIAQVQAEQVRQVMNKYVKDGEMTIIVVAPAEAVKGQLEKLGEVQVIPMPARRHPATQPATTTTRQAA